MKKSRSCICVFDCESIPDVDSLRAVYGFVGDDKSVMLKAFEMQKEKTGSEFLPVNFHKIIAISAVMADEFGKFERVSSIVAHNERELLNKFLSFINTANPRLISFNGRGFDLPAIMVRAMRYNLSCPAYFDTSSPEIKRDKWCNYRSRYDGVFHLDLLDHISEFRAVSGLNLNSLCKSFNLPGKYDIAGDDVYALYLEGELEKINEYCESDTLNTYWLFLKYELLRGNILLDDYANCISYMSDYLIKNRSEMSYTEVFYNFIQSELLRLKDPNLYNEPSYEYENKDLDEQLSLNGLDGLVKRGVDGIKTISKTNTVEESTLPEINLDDE